MTLYTFFFALAALGSALALAVVVAYRDEMTQRAMVPVVTLMIGLLGGGGVGAVAGNQAGQEAADEVQQASDDVKQDVQAVKEQVKGVKGDVKDALADKVGDGEDQGTRNGTAPGGGGGASPGDGN
jgi:hypothetical protein